MTLFTFNKITSFPLLCSRSGELSSVDLVKYLRECCGSKLLALTNGSKASVISSEDNVRLAKHATHFAIQLLFPKIIL